MSYISSIRSKIGHDPIILVGVCGIIMFGDKILLQKRADNKTWCLPGGLMELGENATKTLERELMEEIDVEITSSEFFGVYTNRPIITYPNGDKSQPIGIFLLCSGLRVPIAKDETLEVAYFSKEELPENIFSVHQEPIADLFAGKRNVLK